jgi:hypothetical protein
LFSYFYPKLPDQSAVILQHAVARSAKILGEHGLPKDLSFARIAEPCGAYPLDFLSKDATWYQDTTRVSTARAWIAGDGIVYVAMSANAARSGVDTNDCLVLTSLSNIYGPARAPAPVVDSNTDGPATITVPVPDAATTPAPAASGTPAAAAADSPSN